MFQVRKSTLYFFSAIRWGFFLKGGVFAALIEKRAPLTQALPNSIFKFYRVDHGALKPHPPGTIDRLLQRIDPRPVDRIINHRWKNRRLIVKTWAAEAEMDLTAVIKMEPCLIFHPLHSKERKKISLDGSNRKTLIEESKSGLIFPLIDGATVKTLPRLTAGSGRIRAGTADESQAHGFSCTPNTRLRIALLFQISSALCCLFTGEREEPSDWLPSALPVLMGPE